MMHRRGALGEATRGVAVARASCRNWQGGCGPIPPVSQLQGLVQLQGGQSLGALGQPSADDHGGGKPFLQSVRWDDAPWARLIPAAARPCLSPSAPPSDYRTVVWWAAPSPSSPDTPSCTQVRHYKGGQRGKSPPKSELSNSPPPPPVIYHGAFSSTLRGVKLLSLSTCILSVTFGPVVTFLTAPAVSVLAKGAIASLMVMFSASTTAGLHWFTSPYIHKLQWTPGADSMTVEVLSWIATKSEKKIKLSDVRYVETSRPLVSFEAGGRYYFIDKDNFPDAQLLEKLLPEPPRESM